MSRADDWSQMMEHNKWVKDKLITPPPGDVLSISFLSGTRNLELWAMDVPDRNDRLYQIQGFNKLIRVEYKGQSNWSALFCH